MSKWAICRICLKLPLADLANNIYESEDVENVPLPHAIEEFGGITLKSKFDLPNLICLKCLMLLKAAIKFRMLCQSSEKRFQSLLTQSDERNNELTPAEAKCPSLSAKSFENIILKLENGTEEDESEFGCTMDNMSDMTPMTETLDEDHTKYLTSEQDKDMVEVIEYLQEDTNDDANEGIDTIDMHFIVVEDNELKVPLPLPPMPKVEVAIGDAMSSEKVDTTEVANHSEEDDKSLVPLVQKSGKRKAARLSTPKRQGQTRKRSSKSSGPKSTLPAHICCHCGNFYSEKAKLTAHMKIHCKQKPHECEICHKRFTQTPQLTRHMNSHTGNRPYSCQYCDSRFADPSTKVKHERIHTRERPYKCDTCQKAFAYSNVLKVHMMIHTGEKPFECRFCGRKFSQLHHKRAHEKLHEDDD